MSLLNDLIEFAPCAYFRLLIFCKRKLHLFCMPIRPHAAQYTADSANSYHSLFAEHCKIKAILRL